MRDKNLRPSLEADRAVLARRVFLDLTGLPPSVVEVETFLADPDPQAYERLVDDLLQRPAYGEHWAQHWLDLARYADSAGYADDPPRTIWAYRDWDSLNDNILDRFTITIGGDLLPQPTNDHCRDGVSPNTNEQRRHHRRRISMSAVARANTTMA
jgi:hypothetical protein